MYVVSGLITLYWIPMGDNPDNTKPPPLGSQYLPAILCLGVRGPVKFPSLHISVSTGLALCPVIVWAAMLLRYHGCSFPVTSRRHSRLPVLLQPLKLTFLLQCFLNHTQNNNNLNLSHEKPKVELLVTVIQVSPKTF